MGNPVWIHYTNWKGETGWRYIDPARLIFGSTDFHPEPQWLLEAYDLGKDAPRVFAMRDIHIWRTPKDDEQPPNLS